MTFPQIWEISTTIWGCDSCKYFSSVTRGCSPETPGFSDALRTIQGAQWVAARATGEKFPKSLLEV
jgi:hypothetical protein